jgi:hypothetical protein
VAAVTVDAIRQLSPSDRLPIEAAVWSEDGAQQSCVCSLEDVPVIDAEAADCAHTGRYAQRTRVARRSIVAGRGRRFV